MGACPAKATRSGFTGETLLIPGQTTASGRVAWRLRSTKKGEGRRQKSGSIAALAVGIG